MTSPAPDAAAAAGGQPPAEAAASERYRDILVAAFDAIEAGGDLDAMGRYFLPGYVRHSSEGDRSLTGFREVLEALHAAMPDFSFTIVDTVAERDRVAYRWEATGTHLGVYLGVPPTRRRVRASGITISRFEGDRIAEDWASFNQVSILHTLGIIPLQ